MSSLCFCVPAHGRVELTRICLAQLRLTCDALTAEGVHASAIVVADDENLDTAKDLGFGTVRRNNDFLSRRFNDAIQLACDRRHNPTPFTHVAPFGSDDFADYRLFLDLPAGNTVLAFKQAAFVNEDGTQIVSRMLDYPGGVGIRVYPRQLMARCGYRPADEDRVRGCDTSILVNLTRTFANGNPQIVYGDLHPFQVIDFKSRDAQLNPYTDVVTRHRKGSQPTDPFDALADIYPAESLEAMRDHYAARMLVAA